MAQLELAQVGQAQDLAELNGVWALCCATFAHTHMLPPLLLRLLLPPPPPPPLLLELLISISQAPRCHRWSPVLETWKGAPGSGLRAFL